MYSINFKSELYKYTINLTKIVSFFKYEFVSNALFGIRKPLSMLVNSWDSKSKFDVVVWK